MSGWTRRSFGAALLASGLLPVAARAGTLAIASPPLWLARGAAGSAILFGQMPVRADMAWQSLQVMTAFENSAALWLENPVFTREEVEALIGENVGRQRPTAAEFLPTADLERLRAQVAQAGAPREAFDQIPADDLFQQLSALADEKSRADFTRLPERVFREMAAASAKPIVTEWSSLAEVAGFIPPAPSPVRLQLIRLGLDDVDMADQAVEHMRAWIGGDAAHFDRLGAIIAYRYPDLVAKMSGERNRRLAERLATAMEQPGQHFVCVGIRHVSGPASIQSFLTGLGLAVERLA